MYTQCTECRQQHVLTIKKLRSSQGIIRCNSCSSMFNALEQLSEKPLPSIPLQNKVFSTHTQTLQQVINWNIGITLCTILFAVQFYFFEGYNLTQNATFRPWLTSACQPIGCTLPIYKNLTDFAILHGSLQTISEHHSVFKTAFTNQSDFAQNYPSIKLIFQNYSGTDFAERTFQPHEFMSNPSAIIKPDMSTEIALDIATPSNKISGYRFELI